MSGHERGTAVQGNNETASVEHIGVIDDAGTAVRVPPHRSVDGRAALRLTKITAGIGAAAFSFVILYTAATADPPSPPNPLPTDQASTIAQCDEVLAAPAIRGNDPTKWAENQKTYETQVGYSLEQCTVAAAPVAGAIIEPVTACEAIGGRPTTWPEEEYPTLLRERPPLPDGQSILAVTNLEKRTTTEVGITFPSSLIELCGPATWTYQHAGQTRTQAIPANEDLGMLPEGQHFVYRPTPEGGLELLGIENPNGYLLPLPDQNHQPTPPVNNQ
ncbi:hypothetical protein [Arthrobacter agilis]|uniref:hypothetical protein n=1 Tax=Arthrobacter agilis TaxID=37921 RepID=UPI002788F837|nr:hypothetical protein [Arthrobacter agilis]MDQ0734790.1 hypothetical protein [Arthrobacter agilis]